jgi:hypothetical protein
MITKGERSTHEITSRISMAKAAITSKLDLNFRNKLVKCYIWRVTSYAAETWTLRKVDQ